MAVGKLTVRVLGPVQLIGVDGELVDLPSASQRRLLAALALHASRPVRAEWLCGVLDVTPGALRTSVSRLRRSVGDGRLQTTIGGYRLDAPVDATLACAEIQSGTDDPVVLARALERWVGPALEEFADEPWAVGEAARLAAIRAAAVEDLAEALIVGNRADDALALLEPHVIEHPWRDRPRGLTLRALAASGRPTEALRAYQAYRQALGDTAGTEPSADLRAIEQRIATGWDGVEPAPSGPTQPVPGPGRARSAPALHEAAQASVGLGRSDELAVLVEAAERALDGGVRTVLISGEAGIGKTTLMTHFAREICAPSGWSVFYGRCDEHLAVPFQPFPWLVSGMVQTLSDDALNAHTATHGSDLLRLVPQLQARIAPTASAPVGEEGTARHRLFEAVVDITERAAAVAPILLVLDDLHWAGPAALHLLQHLMRNLANEPVLVVAGFRDTGEAAGDDLRGALADLARHDAARVELVGLDRSALEDLVRTRVTTTAGRDVSQVVDRLEAETAGNPLFAEHLLRHWATGRKFAVDDDIVTLSTLPVEVPPSLRDLVWPRVMVLGPEVQPTLTAAAVLGVQFHEQVLASMTGLGESEIARVLDRAVAAGVLAEQASISGAVRFTHALVARSLEAELGSRERRRLHAQAFEAILDLQLSPPADLAPQLARHAELGQLGPEAVRWAVEAGEAALADLAPDEAASWFTRALDQAVALGRPDAEQADLLVRLGEAESRAGHPTALDTIHRGADLARSSGADATLVRAALATDRGTGRLGSFAADQLHIVEAAVTRVDPDDLETRARLTALLAQSLGPTDQAVRQRAAALEALDLARSSPDTTLLARIAPNVLFALWTPGAGALRAALAAEATAIVDDMDDPHLAYLVHYAAHNSAVCAGDAEPAARYLDRIHAIAEELGEAGMRWGVGILDGYTATMTGRLVEAERVIGATLELGMEIGEPDAFPSFAAQTYVLGTFAGRHAELFPITQQAIEAEPYVELTFRIAHAILCCEVGRGDEARTLLHDAMGGRVDPIPDDWVRSTTLIGLAIVAIELDDLDGATWLYPQIAPMAGEVSYNGVTSQGPISAYVGKLAFLLGRHEAAEQHLLDALATAKSFGWVYHQATTQLALAQNRLRADGALDDEGMGWLDSATQLCAAHGFTIWGRRTAALRATLAAAP
ncbi:MAG: ATP-binding protein [Acidimicrobiales bacterium]